MSSFSKGALPPLSPAAPRREGRIFISGHSLTDPPFGPFLEDLGRGVGGSVRYEEQSLPGSTLKSRTRGEGSGATWSGYKTGRNRSSENLDVLAELASPREEPGRPYDTLLVTERHDLLGVFVWDDTLTHLRDFQQRFARATPNGVMYFYEPWLSVNDKANPEAWVRYERAASPVWQCTTTRINLELAAGGSPQRIHAIPAAWALAELVDRAVRKPADFGFTGDALAVMNELFSDDVHPTPLGVQYVASFAFGVMFGVSPVDAPAPPDLPKQKVAPLRLLAWELAQEARERRRRLDMAECREYLRSSFIDAYWDYVSLLHWERGMGALTAPLKRFRHKREWKSAHFPDGALSPFADVPGAGG